MNTCVINSTPSNEYILSTVTPVLFRFVAIRHVVRGQLSKICYGLLLSRIDIETARLTSTDKYQKCNYTTKYLNRLVIILISRVVQGNGFRLGSILCYLSSSSLHWHFTLRMI